MRYLLNEIYDYYVDIVTVQCYLYGPVYLLAHKQRAAIIFLLIL